MKVLSKEVLLDRLREYQENQSKKEKNFDGYVDINSINELISKIPEIEIQDTPAKWISNDEDDNVYCSHCKHKIKFNNLSKYCPNCGYKMDKEIEKEED